MKLKDESEKLISFSSQLVIGNVVDPLTLDPQVSGIRLVEQTQDIEQGALAAARRSDDGVRQYTRSSSKETPRKACTRESSSPR